jgi:hypothetical protein
MFRAPLCPSSGARDYTAKLPHAPSDTLAAGGRRSGAAAGAAVPNPDT